MTAQLQTQRNDLVDTNRQFDERRRFTEAVLSGVSAGVIGLSSDGRITIANRSAAELLGADAASMTGQNVKTVMPELNQLLARLAISEFAEIGDQLELTRGGRTRSLNIRIVKDAVDGEQRYVATFDDITQLIAAQRNAAWGDVARRIAHEIKNPLTPIKLSVQHLRRAYRDGLPEFDAVLEENVAQILTEIDRLTEISREFSRYGALERKAPLEAIQLADVVREALTLYRVADDAITYRDEVAADLPPVVARRGEMKEVLLNLVENAREALDGRGTILVRAASSDGRVDVAVEDDGPGIPPELLARVFDPHFSTRSTGTGLGLAIVRRLVEGWGGTVNAQSDPGRGTVVRIRLQASRTGGR
jgi:two-component system nitrogen regulation sensor histidine kinase NtrY